MAFFDGVQKNPRAMRFIGRGVRQGHEGDYLLQGSMEHLERFGFSLGVVTMRDKAKVVGQVGLYHYNLIMSDPRIELAFVFLPAYWGKGFASEAVKHILAWAWEEEGIDEVVAVVHPENQASQHVLTKCGFRHTDMTTREGLDVEYWTYQRPKQLDNH